MNNILIWNNVSKKGYTQEERLCTVSLLVYKVTKIPNFNDPRFSYLAKDVDGRVKEVTKKQMQMLRSLCLLNENWAVCMRIMKQSNELAIYLIFRYASNNQETRFSYNEEIQIRNSLMNNEYSFQKVEDEKEIQYLLETEWMNEVAEITKYEEKYNGDVYPNGQCRSFYSVSPWTPTDNTMEYICEILVNTPCKVCVDVTLTPTKYLAEEKDWMNTNINALKECMNGEEIKGNNAKTIWKGKKLPILKTPLDFFEKMNKQYEMSTLFLGAIRIYSEGNAQNIASSFVTNSVRSQANIQLFRKGYSDFDYLCDCYRNVNISALIHPKYWNLNKEDVPFRAQRLHRLLSVEEASNYFRLPISNKSKFPGFSIDVGLKDFSSKKNVSNAIHLGTYLDIPGSLDTPATFDVQQFAKHGLIVGVPGSGKTTAMFNILHQLWAKEEKKRIPFIILEPAKTEYRALKALPEFKDDMLVFTLGDETTSPFRFNPLEVLPGIRLENHMSRLQACFIGAFDLFDPLPLFLEQAIHRTYLEKGWYDDSIGGEIGLETPTLKDLCRNAEYIVENSGFDTKMKSDFKASLLERLNSLRRGSKGKMLDTKNSIPMDDLMEKPVVLELDNLNGSEKSLLMMFLLNYVYEYCKIKRKSGTSLKHMLLVEEAHNLIGANGGGSQHRADPKEKAIELFTNMLAEMRALGEGILIADQLPTAIAPQAVKQTNVKILMRITAKDDREEIGNTMDLNEEQMHQVVRFKTGHSYLYHEGEDQVRMLRMLNFKGMYNVEEPQTDIELKNIMSYYEQEHKELYLPFSMCKHVCNICDRRVRKQAEELLSKAMIKDPYATFGNNKDVELINYLKEAYPLCDFMNSHITKEKRRLQDRYSFVGDMFHACTLVQMYDEYPRYMNECKVRCKKNKKCDCVEERKVCYIQKAIK